MGTLHGSSVASAYTGLPVPESQSRAFGPKIDERNELSLGARLAFTPDMRHDSSIQRLSFIAAAAILLACVLLPGVAAAQGGAGLRAGVSADPDQFYFGGHFDTGYVVERLSFRPNVEVGVGNDLTTVAANFEFAYWFPIPDQPWNIYAGGGPAMNIYRFHESHTDTKPGFNLVGGIAHDRGLFAEVKLGLIDSPEIKFGIGFTWR